MSCSLPETSWKSLSISQVKSDPLPAFPLWSFLPPVGPHMCRHMHTNTHTHTRTHTPYPDLHPTTPLPCILPLLQIHLFTNSEPLSNQINPTSYPWSLNLIFTHSFIQKGIEYIPMPGTGNIAVNQMRQSLCSYEMNIFMGKRDNTHINL